MNTHTHTPGPWTVKKEEKFLVMGTFITVRDSHDGVIAGTHVDDKANARLIAAAPDLLEIVKAYRNLLRTMASTEGELATFSHIESVLAKAKGNA